MKLKDQKREERDPIPLNERAGIENMELGLDKTPFSRYLDELEEQRKYQNPGGFVSFGEISILAARLGEWLYNRKLRKNKKRRNQ